MKLSRAPSYWEKICRELSRHAHDTAFECRFHGDDLEIAGHARGRTAGASVRAHVFRLYGERSILNELQSAIERIERVLFPPRPPKGWRLFGRRPRVVLA